MPLLSVKQKTELLQSKKTDSNKSVEIRKYFFYEPHFLWITENSYPIQENHRHKQVYQPFLFFFTPLLPRGLKNNQVKLIKFAGIPQIGRKSRSGEW